MQAQTDSFIPPAGVPAATPGGPVPTGNPPRPGTDSRPTAAYRSAIYVTNRNLPRFRFCYISETAPLFPLAQAPPGHSSGPSQSDLCYKIRIAPLSVCDSSHCAPLCRHAGAAAVRASGMGRSRWRVPSGAVCDCLRFAPVLAGDKRDRLHDSNSSPSRFGRGGATPSTAKGMRRGRFVCDSLHFAPLSPPAGVSAGNVRTDPKMSSVWLAPT